MSATVPRRFDEGIGPLVQSALGILGGLALIALGRVLAAADDNLAELGDD